MIITYKPLCLSPDDVHIALGALYFDNASMLLKERLLDPQQMQNEQHLVQDFSALEILQKLVALPRISFRFSALPDFAHDGSKSFLHLIAKHVQDRTIVLDPKAPTVCYNSAKSIWSPVGDKDYVIAAMCANKALYKEWYHLEHYNRKNIFYTEQDSAAFQQKLERQIHPLNRPLVL